MQTSQQHINTPLETQKKRETHSGIWFCILWYVCVCVSVRFVGAMNIFYKFFLNDNKNEMNYYEWISFL